LAIAISLFRCATASVSYLAVKIAALARRAAADAAPHVHIASLFVAECWRTSWQLRKFGTDRNYLTTWHRRSHPRRDSSLTLLL